MRRLLVILLLLCSSLTWAGRLIPNDMDVAILRQVSYPQIVVSNGGLNWLKALTLGWLDHNQTLDTASGLRIRDEHNLFITKGKLTTKIGKAIAIRRNGNTVDEIWVLTDSEYKKLEQQMKQQ